MEADRSQLEQVLMNLALNAREAMPDGGRLRIAAANDVMRDAEGPSARAVKLIVEDTGRGMAPEVTAHAFEPFFTTKPAGGIGLGLATVHGIVTQAGGRVELDSVPGQGTTVTVWLPAVRRGAARVTPTGAPRGRGETALVVEDADAVRVLTGRILYSAGYQVIPAENGVTALERLDAADVLVTDVVMPGMSGVELATAARERRPELPVVFVSGYTGNEIVAAGGDPAISVTIGINHSPLAGQDGDKLTARQIQNRLEAELIGNVSIRMLPTERPDTWEIQGRGELQLAILVELMRREGFELTVGKPQVVVRLIDGERHEPVERLTIDVPEEYVGVITQMLALRKGRMEQMINHGTGWVRMDFLVPARGLIGFRTEFLTETRGTGLLHHVFDRWEPWAGDMRLRPTGSLVSDRKGKTASFALFNLQERGTMFVEPGEDVYEGMIVGENARAEDLDVNAVKEKHLTNMRSSTSDVLVRLVPARKLSLDQALEFVREDECVEVTPRAVRLRKVALSAVDRVKAARRMRA